MVSKIIISTAQLLHPEQMTADDAVVFRIGQVNLRRDKVRLLVRKYEHFIDLHAEQEFPSQRRVESLVNRRKTVQHPLDSFEICHDLFLIFTIIVYIDGDMMVISQVHEISRSLREFQLSVFVPLVVQSRNTGIETKCEFTIRM